SPSTVVLQLALRGERKLFVWTGLRCCDRAVLVINSESRNLFFKGNNRNPDHVHPQGSIEGKF
ncbi:hypothetical protein L195_g063982, partial [Trifolium pratense]